MTKEEILLKKRFVELSNAAFNRNIPVFTDFLNLNELNIFHSVSRELYTPYEVFGGYESAERQMIVFIPDAFSRDIQELYPISVIRIAPSHKKYADSLTHRDFLGALINLGVDRSKVGDILVKDNEAILFCHENLADFFIEQLTKVKHTNVKVLTESLREFNYEPEFKMIKGSVSTTRIDSMLTLCCSCSRSQAVEYIMAKKVFLNGRLIEANSETVKEQDVISVRGVGKFVFTGILSETKKGKIFIEIKKYV
ncbi:YlmH family RNA-binding protein [Konateibacter massiliensis]|uniref:YlmH family RNA-binding protein n=1 Tax=Konateibacter massiliensis TaxID=2002841 RepID=UPI000C162461|nr:YlmH/Sll1252 family protein [Konateibacter massiliensis]